MSEYTEAQKAYFKQQWALIRRRQYIAALPFFVFFGSMAILNARKGDAVVTASDGLVLVLLLALVVGSIVFALQNWRCPACRRILGSEVNPRFCLNAACAQIASGNRRAGPHLKHRSRVAVVTPHYADLVTDSSPRN